jgi:3-oxoacyl-[acyl-carrier protein] reductase
LEANLKDKVVLVTGGSRGIGQAVVRRFAAEGATVVFTYAGNKAAADELVAAVQAAGGRTVGAQVDVRDAAGMAGTVDMIEKEHGRLDVLVNNAGIIRDTLVMAMESQDWDDVLATNLTGTFNAIKPAARLMMRRRQGAIVNLSSIAATRPGRGHANYAASKGGIEALTKALAVELGAKNIRVNCVAPGMIETDMSKDVRSLAGDQILSRITLKRYGTSDDVANAVVFLASDLSAYVTGTVLHVDGGIGA